MTSYISLGIAVTALVDKKFEITKERMIELMNERNIDCRPFFYPLSSLPAYENLERAQKARRCNLVSYQISPYGINLPSGLNMTEDKVQYVCNVLKGILLR